MCLFFIIFAFNNKKIVNCRNSREIRKLCKLWVPNTKGPENKRAKGLP